MNDRETRRYDMFGRVKTFGTDNTADFAAGGEGKKIEPIRNRADKVGRNDPCPCGSGKKFKNCCMRTTAK